MTGKTDLRTLKRMAENRGRCARAGMTTAWFACVVLALLVIATPWQTAVAQADKSDAPAAPAGPKFIPLTGKLHEEKLRWKDNWLSQSTGRTPAADAALAVATSKNLSRKELRKELAVAGEKYQYVTRNLDVGRHQLVKWLTAQAIAEANRRLAESNLEGLKSVRTVNSGGTGDYTRDVDVTVFAGDEVRERAFFEAFRDLAEKEGLTVETDPNLGVKAGINIPQIEVALHRGINDLPDPRYASDVQTFALDYRAAIEKQARNPEAYFGYGFEVEVQGRRSLSFKPGQTLVQEFEWDGKSTRYIGQIAACQREVRSILKGAIGQRYRRAQAAVHITNDYLQAFRHSQGADHDLSKGSLKYAGRALEQLCEFHGFRPWPELLAEDRIQLLARVFPPGYLDQPANRERLAKLATAMDVAYLTYLNKAVPKSVSGSAGNTSGAPAKSTPSDGPKGAPSAAAPVVVDPTMAGICDGLALSFLMRATEMTAGSVAEEMLNPPHLSERFLAEVNKSDSAWQKMNAAEREAYARSRDENYRACVSVAAMENLLAQVHQLMVLDLPEFNRSGSRVGTRSTRRMLEAADPKIRPLLEIAVQHGAAAVDLDRQTTPEGKARARQAMDAARARLQAAIGRTAPGSEVITAASRIEPRQYVKDRLNRRTGPWGQAVDEMRQRARQHLEECFPPRDYEGFKARIKAQGVKSYLSQRLVEETLQPGNLSDALTLIEMYQNGADQEAYATYLGTVALSRCYWGMGFLIQAWNVQTPDDLKELGKNVIFDAFARVVPGVGTCKLAFDIGRGIVVVTVGYTFNQLNADLIDAMYTGEAGRINKGMEGKVAGRLRDAVDAVLPDEVVLKKTDDAGKVNIVIDQGGVYRHFFKKWSNARTDYDEINSREPIGGDAGRFAQAHDRVVRLLQDAWNRTEGGWFGQEATGYKFNQKQLDEAMQAFAQEVRKQARPVTDKVINEMAPREFWSGGQEVISDGLHQRLVNDVLAGLMETWQTHRAEQLLARREVESMASLADTGAMASVLDANRPGGEPLPEYELVVGENQDDLDQVFDGNQPIPFSCVLKAKKPSPSDVPDCTFEVKEDAYVLPAGVKEPKPGTIVKQKLTVRAVLASGAVLAEKTLQIQVRLPDDLTASLKAANMVQFDATLPEVSMVFENFHPKRGKITWSGNQITCTEESQGESDLKDTHYASKSRVIFTGTVNSARRTIDISFNSSYFDSKRRKEFEAIDQGNGRTKYGNVMHTISTEKIIRLDAKAIPIQTNSVSDKSVWITFELSANRATLPDQVTASLTTIEKDNDKQQKGTAKGAFGSNVNKSSDYFVRLLFLTAAQ